METQKPKETEQKSTNNGIPKGGWWFVAIFAVVVFIGFGIYISHMYKEAETWDHLVFIFNNIQTFVFAAGTFIFGREINRNSANASEKRANDAEKQKIALEKIALEKEAETKKQLERGQTIAKMFRSQVVQNRSMGIKLGAVKADDDSPEINGFMELLDEWYPKE